MGHSLLRSYSLAGSYHTIDLYRVEFVRDVTEGAGVDQQSLLLKQVDVGGRSSEGATCVDMDFSLLLSQTGTGMCVCVCVCVYSGTPIKQTPLGRHFLSFTVRCPLFRGKK